MSYLINNKAAGAHQSIETGIRFAASLGCEESVPQFRGFNEVGFHTVLAAGVTKCLRQMSLARPGRANKCQIPVRVDGAEGWQCLQTFYIPSLE